MDLSCGASNGLFLIFPTSIFVRCRVMVSLPIEFFFRSCVWHCSSYRAWFLLSLAFGFSPPIEIGFLCVSCIELLFGSLRLDDVSFLLSSLASVLLHLAACACRCDYLFVCFSLGRADVFVFGCAVDGVVDRCRLSPVAPSGSACPRDL